MIGVLLGAFLVSYALVYSGVSEVRKVPNPHAPVDGSHPFGISTADALGLSDYLKAGAGQTAPIHAGPSTAPAPGGLVHGGRTGRTTPPSSATPRHSRPTRVRRRR